MFSNHRSFLGHWSLMFGGYGTSVRVIKDNIASNYFSDTTKHTSQDVPTSYHRYVFKWTCDKLLIHSWLFVLRGCYTHRLFLIKRSVLHFEIYPTFLFYHPQMCLDATRLCGGFPARSMTEWMKALGAYVEHLKVYDFILPKYKHEDSFLVLVLSFVTTVTPLQQIDFRKLTKFCQVILVSN